MAKEEKPPDLTDVLDSWKEIAGYMRRNVRTCQRWEKRLGLPIRRYENSPKSRVFVFKQEIDVWLRSQNSDHLESHSRAALWRRAASRKTVWPILGACLLIPLILLGVRTRHIAVPSDFEIEGTRLVILDGDGRPLGSFETDIQNLMKKMEFVLSQSEGTGVSWPVSKTHSPFIVFEDIDGDGSREVLFCPRTTDRNSQGRLLCLSGDGRLLWQVRTGQAADADDEMTAGNYSILGFTVCDIDNDGGKEIMAVSGHLSRYSSQVLILDPRGNELAEYRDFSRVTDYALLDFEGGGRQEIILSGENTLDQYFGTVLETGNVSSVPQADSPFPVSLRPRQNFFFPGSKLIHSLCGPSHIPMYIDLVEEKDGPRLRFNHLLAFDLTKDFRLIDVRISLRFMLQYEAHRNRQEGSMDLAQVKEGLLNQGILLSGREMHSRIPADPESVTDRP